MKLGARKCSAPGWALPCARVIEIDRERSRLIFSERTAHDTHKPDDMLTRLHPGAMCAGVVSNVCHFGVFVDLGGVEGLIHISELSWGRVGHPRRSWTLANR
ncbi:MAG: S1 RNA-binding domain-containing protein [Anaerolineae bacterium]|nr:MAG: S1 RNA-binding domain-containing protein [Anaerolineae bacterium]